MKMFDQSLIDDIRAHALREYPKECCGIIVNDKYLPQKNIHKQPEYFFKISDDVFLQNSKAPQAIVHSHTNGNTSPSLADMQAQVASQLPWGLVETDGNYCSQPYFWGDNTPIPPLLGREYVFGVTDCFSLIKDYYQQILNINLSEVPRDETILESKNSIYLDQYKSLGFKIISSEEAKPGDVFLAQIASNTVNHGGVLFSEDGLILHHLYNHLSTKEPIFRWNKFITHWLRHEEKNNA